MTKATTDLTLDSAMLYVRSVPGERCLLREARLRARGRDRRPWRSSRHREAAT